MQNQVIFLIGYMGSGKTTLGRKLARRLQWSFMDLDHQIVAAIGRSIPEYFAEHGEEAFRVVERDTLRAIDLTAPVVIATGGGTPCFHENMDWMNRQGVTIYLRMNSRALWRRLSRSDISSRPVLAGLAGQALLDFIEEKLAGRIPFYEKAHLIMNPLSDKPAAMIEAYQAMSRVADRSSIQNKT